MWKQPQPLPFTSPSTRPKQSKQQRLEDEMDFLFSKDRNLDDVEYSEEEEEDRPNNRNRNYWYDNDDDDSEDDDEEEKDDFQDYLDELYEREWEEYMQRMMGDEMMTGDNDNTTEEENDNPNRLLGAFFNELHSNYPFYEDEEGDEDSDDDDYDYENDVNYNPFLRRDPVSGEEKIDHDLLLLMTKLLLGEKLNEQDENHEYEPNQDDPEILSTVSKSYVYGQNTTTTITSNPRQTERPTYWTIQAAIQRAIDNSSSSSSY
jgi:hypothetical protein